MACRSLVIITNDRKNLWKPDLITGCFSGKTKCKFVFISLIGVCSHFCEFFWVDLGLPEFGRTPVSGGRNLENPDSGELFFSCSSTASWRWWWTVGFDLSNPNWFSVKCFWNKNFIFILKKKLKNNFRIWFLFIFELFLFINYFKIRNFYYFKFEF